MSAFRHFTFVFFALLFTDTSFAISGFNVNQGPASAQFTCSKCRRPLIRCSRCGRFHHDRNRGVIGNFQGQPTGSAGLSGAGGLPGQHNAGFGGRNPAGLQSAALGGAGQDGVPNISRGEARMPTEEELKKIGKDGLIPAGVNGNPGWSLKIPIGGGSFGMCQATLVFAEAGVCKAATANHCVDDFPNAAQVPFFSADFGLFKATVSRSESQKRDWAVLEWHCPSVADNVPVVPVCKEEPKVGEQMYYGKVMGGKPGLYPGVPWNEPGVVGVNGEPVGTSIQAVAQNSSVLIQQGDSGGGLYRKLGENQYCLAGVLSTGDDLEKRRSLGNYAVKESIKDMVRRNSLPIS